MSVVTKLTELETDITNAYLAIQTKGGTIPESKNTNNLDTAIASIPSGGVTPTGNINITTTSQVDVTNFATAQVVDSNLVASNIKKDINVLGIVGNFEGGKEEQTKSVTITANGISTVVPDANKTLSSVAITTNISTITDRMVNTLWMMTERKNNVNCVETFDYDNGSYSVLDLSIFDNYDNGAFKIKNIGQRTLNSFSGGTSNKIRIKMPGYLESISGANWHGTSYVKYYDFSGYKRNTVPTYSSTTTSLGNSNARVLVPASLYSSWTTATGWSSFATQIVSVNEEYE